MERCKPEDMRKALEAVEQFKQHGIEFVAVPVLDTEHKATLLAESGRVLDFLIKLAEKADD